MASAVGANPNNVPTNAAHRFAHIDALRAFAVMLVVVAHSGFSWVPGDGGVTLFFGVSGFVITFVLLRERDKTGRFGITGFYRRRFLKIAPPFVVAILIPTFIYMRFGTVNPGAFLSQVFFSYNWLRIFDPAAGNQVLPGSDVVWSLAVEEQFYIVFAVLWLLLVRVSWWRNGLIALSCTAIVASTVVRCVLSTVPGAGVYVLRATDARMDGIAWGVLAAVALHAWNAGLFPWLSRFGRDWALIVAGLLYVGAFVFQDNWAEYAFRPSLDAIASVLVILYGMLPGDTGVKRIFYRASEIKLVQTIGLASYSIYLIHHPLVFLLMPLLGNIPHLAAVIVLVIIGTGAGIVLYFLVEVPALRLKRHYERRALKPRNRAAMR